MFSNSCLQNFRLHRRGALSGALRRPVSVLWAASAVCSAGRPSTLPSRHPNLINTLSAEKGLPLSAELC
ncbi:hypothetical protein HMPREF1545_01269 [Oscillibacter sp. KLE 1728]|nr:hypothetical protein HMPREF1545_01269 [Oscillibacter sp. KLE 1728]